MKEAWRPLQHWSIEEELDTWLQQQGLQNSQAIIGKLALGETLVFAKGTRHLRYAEGTFYLEQREELTIGIGRHLNRIALQARWQVLVPRAKVTVRFSTNPAAPRWHIIERDVVKGADHLEYSYLIELNPAKLGGPNQVTKMVDEVEYELTR